MPLESWVGDALTGSLLLAIPVAVLAGLVSFASPCVLPLLPGYWSYASGLGAAEIADGTGDRRVLVLGTAGFVLGVAGVFVLTGALIGGAGTLLLEHERAVQVVAGLAIIVLGAGFAGWLPLPAEARLRVAPRAGVAASPLLGAAFGLGWTPCIGPALSVVLTLALDEGSVARGAFLAFCYALGLGVPFLVLAVGFTGLSRRLQWLRTHQRGFQIAGAVALIVVGLAMVTGAWNLLVAQLRVWAASFGTIL
ncbi:MAG: cytochrome c biogenesis CcdA family protein [Arachnia sp.]